MNVSEQGAKLASGAPKLAVLAGRPDPTRRDAPKKKALSGGELVTSCLWRWMHVTCLEGRPDDADDGDDDDGGGGGGGIT